MRRMKLVILGAHTAVGKVLAETLKERALDEVLAATTLDHLEGDLHLIDESTLSGAKLIFLASDDSFTRKIAQGADRMPVPLVDVTGDGHEGAKLVFPHRNESLRSSTLYRVPTGFVYGVVSILQALGEFRPRSAQLVTMEGAAGAGQAGMDELSEQTRGIFAQQSKEPEVFYAPVAFSVLSSVGAEDDPFDADLRLAEEVRTGLNDRDFDLHVVRTRVPVFTAEGASLTIQCEDAPDSTEAVLTALDSVKGLRLTKSDGVTSLEAADRDDVLVGRVRARGTRVDLWLSADRLRHGAAWPAAVLAETWLKSTGAID